MDFVETYGTTFTMLWDPTFDSWFRLGIMGQPASMLLDRFGQVVDVWSGGLPEQQVLEAIGA